MSAYMLPGQMSHIHSHSGPELWYVVEGEQCLQTTTATIKARAGEGAMVAAGDTMRLVVTGNAPRRALVLVLHDSDRPASTGVDSSVALKSCL
jgi:quercetin dioxygenase-like cupin family protein